MVRFLNALAFILIAISTYTTAEANNGLEKIQVLYDRENNVILYENKQFVLKDMQRIVLVEESPTETQTEPVTDAEPLAEGEPITESEPPAEDQPANGTEPALDSQPDSNIKTGKF